MGFGEAVSEGDGQSTQRTGSAQSVRAILLLARGAAPTPWMGEGLLRYPPGGAGGAEPVEFALPASGTRVLSKPCSEREVELFGSREGSIPH